MNLDSLGIVALVAGVSAGALVRIPRLAMSAPLLTRVVGRWLAPPFVSFGIISLFEIWPQIGEHSSPIISSVVVFVVVAAALRISPFEGADDSIDLESDDEF